jgi:hypothetical protein
MDNSARDFPSAPDPAESFNSPIVVNRAARAKRSPHLRIVLLNAAGGAHLDVIEHCLRRPPLDDARLILLCEADRAIGRSGRRDVSGDLAASLGMSCVYVPEYKVGRVGNAFMGNAILSAAPFEQTLPRLGLPPNVLVATMTGSPWYWLSTRSAPPPRSGPVESHRLAVNYRR